MAYEFRWKNTSNWGSASVDPTQLFHAGFNFKSTTSIQLDHARGSSRAQLDQQLPDAAGSRPAGATRPIHGDVEQHLYRQPRLGLPSRREDDGGRWFRLRPVRHGRTNVTVRLFSPLPSANRCNSDFAYGSGYYVASYMTGADGFYFIWQKDLDNTSLARHQHLAERLQVLRRVVRLHRCPGSGRPCRSPRSTGRHVR